MTTLRFLGIRQSDSATLPALMLGDAANQRVLAVGMEEADLPLVCRALHREGCGRESVFGLVHGLLRAAGATTADVWLDLEDGGTLTSILRFTLVGTPTSLPCRPAEAVLLAVRLGAPILASARLAEHMDREGQRDPGPQGGLRVREWVARLRPDVWRN